MAEKVIKNNQSLVPFFGDRLNFIRGLDPLGLQNTSDATFSMLLPGLNNVTGRIRYYSFYTWLLDEYSKRIGSTNPKDQQQFIRRAEYIIALSSSFYEGDASNIPGSLFASKQISKKSNHNLEEGTFQSNGSTSDTYWQFPLGAFGQYYYGSLSDIGLVIRRDQNKGIYVRTNSEGDEFISGELLAKAFDINIRKEAKGIFFDSINKGVFSEDQLRSLLPDFNLTKVPFDTEEDSLLLKLLLQKDMPLLIDEESKAHRRNTIKYLLKFINSHNTEYNDRSFILKCYENKGKIAGITESTIFGWYYYQFNEYWHFANTAILNGILNYLEYNAGPNWLALKPFLENVTKNTILELKERNLIKSEQNSLESVLTKLEANEQKYMLNYAKSEGVDRIANGFLLIFSQYLNQIDELNLLKQYGLTNDLAKEGEGSQYFITEFSTKMEMSIEHYIFEYLYKNIVYRHQYVAFRKIRGGNQSTQKFIIEDHHIRHLGSFNAGFTGPRIGNLGYYLRDLNVIDTNYNLTVKGEELLKKLNNNED